MIGEIRLTETVILADGRQGMVVGIAHTAPEAKLDIQLADGTTLRNVPESQLMAVMAPARPDLIRHQAVRSLPSCFDHTSRLLGRRGAEIKPNPLMAPSGALVRLR